MLNSYAQFFVDCQTTGASPATSKLLEIAWNHQSWVISQSEPVPKRVLKLIGIEPHEIENGAMERDVWSSISRAMEEKISAEGDAFAIAHFARLEQSYLDRLWLEYTGLPFPLPLFCTHKIAKLLYPRLPNYGIRALAGWFGAPLDEGKRAANHVAATRQIWACLAQELEHRGIHNTTQLAAFCGQKFSREKGARDFLIPREKRLGLADKPGVYRYVDRNGKILYVGKATSLKQRVNSYFTGGCRGDHRKLEMLAQAVDVEVHEVETPLAAGLLEFDEIRRLRPPYNIAFKGRGHDPLQHLELLILPPAETEFESRRPLVNEVFHDLDDWDVLRRGVMLWRASSGLGFEEKLTVRSLLNLGLPDLRAWIEAERLRCLEKAAAAMEKDDPDADGADDEESDDADTEFIWTDELVAAACRRLVRRATRHYVRQKWLRRVSGATIAFRPGRSSAKRNAEALSEFVIEPTGEPFEGDEPRRARVLLHELRRAESKGGEWRVVKPWPMLIPFWI